MKTLALQLVVNTLAVLTGAYVLPGVNVNGIVTALVVAIVLGLVNTVIRPILVLLTLPITILTLGLFLLVINALMVMLVGKLVPGFEVAGFGSALLYSVLVTIVASFLSVVTRSRENLSSRPLPPQNR